MTEQSQQTERKALEESLLQRASLLWGQEQAEALRPAIGQLAWIPIPTEA